MAYGDETTKGPEPKLRGVGQWMHNNTSASTMPSDRPETANQNLADLQPGANFLRKRGRS